MVWVRGYTPHNQQQCSTNSRQSSSEQIMLSSFDNRAQLASEPYAPILSSEAPDAVSRTSTRLNTRWNPLFLRRWVLVVFALFFAATIAALQILYSVSRQNSGVATSDSNKHYLWTYGPTAVFVLTTVLWRQVDYAAKSIQPWAEMARKPQPAQNSLLLDYITPFQVVALWKSLHRRHFTVSCTIVVFFLLKVATILSTGIFSLLSVQRNDVAITMMLNNTFDGSAFNQAASVDSRAAYIVYGHHQYNVSLPVGTTSSFASQSFSPSNGFVNGSLTYTASVDVFRARLEDCQSGTLTYNISFDRASNAPIAAYYNTSVSLPGCEITNAKLDAPDWYYLQNQTAHYFGYRGSLQNVSCSNLPEYDSTRTRYMLSVAYSEGFSQDNFTMLNSSNVVCLPSYSIQKAIVTLDTLGNVQALNLTGDGHLLSGVTANDIAQGVLTTSLQASSIMDLYSTDTALDTFLTLMQNATPDFDPHQLLDPGYLNQTGGAVFEGIAAQLANIYLLTPSATTSKTEVQGTLSENVNRLFASNSPIRAMQGVMAATLLFTLIVLFYVPRGVVPRSVDSIAAVAAILSRSPALERRLRGTGHMSLDELETIIDPCKFMTSLRDHGGSRVFEIQVLSRSGSETHAIPKQDGTFGAVKWTRPFVLRRLAIAFTIVTSVAVIITLEVLLSQSRKNQGLGTVQRQDAATRYSWLYVPVLIFLFLGTLFNLMDFEIEFSESYHALTKGDCNASSSMFWNPLRHVSIYSTWNGLKHSRFALTAASASAILAPFLTIVVAGLFSTKATEYGTSVNATALNWFNTTPYSSPTTNVPALVIEGNMSYPQWTYSELAFPQLRLDNQGVIDDSENYGSVHVNLPALRAAVSCSAIPDSRVLQNEIQGGYLSSNISTPEGCGNSGWINGPYIWLTNNIQVPVNSTGYFGQSLTLGFNSQSCPTLALYYGHVTDNQMDHFAAVLCSQSVDRVQANVTLDLPDLSITTNPTVAPGSAVHFSSWYSTFPTLQVLNISSTTDELDNVFTAMVYGRDGVPTNELLDNDKLIETYTHFYRQYTAQLANIYLRADFSALSNNATETVDNPLSAVYLNPNHYRLIQSNISTQILVGVVCALLVCAVMIIFTVDMRNVLPKPMGSIASVASLLAGSRIVDPNSGLIPEGAEFWSDDQWEKSGIWQGEMFRMGWWDKFQQPCETWHGELDDNAYMAISGKDNYNPSMSNGGEVPESHRSFRIDARPRVVS
ncbi:hypothetical protein RBB50_009703 [Rhinocladiella similis]